MLNISGSSISGRFCCMVEIDGTAVVLDADADAEGASGPCGADVGGALDVSICRDARENFFWSGAACSALSSRVPPRSEASLGSTEGFHQ